MSKHNHRKFLPELDKIAEQIPDDYYFKMHRDRFAMTLAAADLPEKKPDDSLRVLDIGCWPGYLSMLLRERGWDVNAIDLAPHRLQHVLDAGVEISSQNLNDEPTLPYPDNYFDRILFTEVFEHLNPACFEKLFASIHRQLKPGGKLVLTTPNRLALNKNLFIPSRWAEPEVDEEGHGHWKEYRLGEVEEPVEKSGLKVLDSRRVGFYTHLGRSNEEGYFPLKDFMKHGAKIRSLAKIAIYPLREIPLLRDSLMVVAGK